MSSLVDPGGGLDVVLEARSDRVVVAVVGEIDLVTAAQFACAMDEAVRCSRRILLDLSGISFMDSNGLGVLARAYRDLSRDPDALVLRAPQAVRRLLTFEGLDHLIEAGP